MKQKMSFVLLTLIALSGASNFAHAAILSAPGILVDGSGKHIFKQCSTCPDEGSSDSDTKGGNGVGSAETTGVGNGFSWLASGTLLGPNGLPVLKARAEVVDPLQGLGSVTANATAQGLQEYHYSGVQDGTYTITFSVNGLLDGDDESIDAGLTVLSSEIIQGADGPRHPSLAPTTRITKVASSTNGSFSESSSVSFTVGAGQDFLVQEFLIASALFVDASSLVGTADAAHTMTASFTAGDVSLLTPVVAVPIPAALGLMLAGLGAVGCIARRRILHNA
ncbi:MAG: hypothetical protein FIA97_07265 [Methylococcaceae bacterium]|nr:hypothetical protein [Methylococcaceae bacterium]